MTVIYKKENIQRDIYSAFLIMNINNDLSTFNIEACNAEFEHFCKLHDIEIERLKQLHFFQYLLIFLFIIA